MFFWHMTYKYHFRKNENYFKLFPILLKDIN